MKAQFWLSISAFLWGVAEATLFFVVPDVILSYIGLKRGVRASALASLYAAVGASIGGAAMFAWSVKDPAAAYDAVLNVPAISAAMGDAAYEAMTTQGWFVATLLGPLSSTPYKLYAVIAPHAGAPFFMFALASIVARLPRFLLVGAGVAWLGRVLAGSLSPRQLIWVLVGAWLLFYAVFFTLMPN